ncbi:MAG: NAD(P)-binding protein [Symploca sp. SIO1C4]|uniref:NAD(P)-binding protein n=1 Tax=Symploca sp. SIO1C4 TaxID=2607765 RepID=A0A6B3NEP7_9CYAN|nr:NAD(P)-binding protein [Symploca sp. SIO1C4]
MISNKTNKFDVIILGSGLAGSILATILARHNLRVLMIDKGSHPRFAIGEAMTPETDLMMEILSDQYSVPEISHLSSFTNICEHISPSSCGLKSAFNFIYHREQEKKSGQENNQISVSNSSHLFRQDIDHYMVKVASNYGVKVLENTEVVNIKTSSAKIEVELSKGESFTASYLVDASGYRSILSQQFNLRETPTRFKTHSRSNFTHMIDVKNYDDCVNSTTKTKKIIPWHKGTIHHIFDGGWMWVIPFNNHEKSTNPVCSVGLNLDPRHYPKTDIPPKQEFQNFLSRFPDIASQFENAKPVRNWVSTGRLQYSSRSCMGERFYLLPHATGFIDPLFSFGLVNSCMIISPLASRILKSVSENDFSTKHFIALEKLQQKLLDYNDNLVNCSYISFSNFNLWDAWRRIWLLGNFIRRKKVIGAKNLKSMTDNGQDILKSNIYDDLDRLTPCFEQLGRNFFQEAVVTVEKVGEGLLSTEHATAQIMSLISLIDFLPANFVRQMAEVSQRDFITPDFSPQFALTSQ